MAITEFVGTRSPGRPYASDLALPPQAATDRRSQSAGSKNAYWRPGLRRRSDHNFLPQTLDRPARVVRIGLVETKLRQHPSHLYSADCPLRLCDHQARALTARGQPRSGILSSRAGMPGRNQLAALMLLVSRETESARRCQDFLAMHNGACYCLTGEIGEEGRLPCFPSALL